MKRKGRVTNPRGQLRQAGRAGHSIDFALPIRYPPRRTREMHMAVFPKIDSPCPYKSNVAAVMDGDMCRMCKRQVFDLSDMRDEERIAFMAGCTEDEVCVSYRIPLRPALAAAAMAVSVMAPMAAAAQEDYVDIVVGGVRAPKHAVFAPATSHAAPALPVVYEDGGKAPAPGDQHKADPAPATKSVKAVSTAP
jgi:hypothetical protein